MSSLEGNVFGAMRLVLPEHRHRMQGDAQRVRARKLPTLDEDTLIEMHYTLEQAMHESRPVRVVRFCTHEDRAYEGTATVQGRMLRIATPGGVEIIPFLEIISIVLL